MSKLILFYVPNKSKLDAKKLAKHLLEKHLIGCANIFPISSMYWWQDKIEEGNEVVLIAKTTQEKASETEKAIKKIHPYSTPCIIKIKTEVNKEYFEWIKSELS